MNADALDVVLWRLDLRYKLLKLRERVVMAIVWSLPKEWVKWAFYRVLAHATSGQWGMTNPGALDWKTALDRWDIPHEPRKERETTYFPTACDESYGPESGQADVNAIILLALGFGMLAWVGTCALGVWYQRRQAIAVERTAEAVEIGLGVPR